MDAVAVVVALVVSVWPDFAKFRRFGKIFKVLGNFLRVYLLFGKILDRLVNFYAFGQVSIDVNGQMLKNKLAIWSHCLLILAMAFGVLFSFWHLVSFWALFACNKLQFQKANYCQGLLQQSS